MRINRLITFVCFLFFLLSSRAQIFAQRFAPGHACIYKGSGLGLCTPDRKAISEPKYITVDQVNRFLIAEESAPFSFPLLQAMPLDLYTPWGKLIQQISGFFPVNDSTMLTYSWNVQGRVTRFVFSPGTKFLTTNTAHEAPEGLGYPHAMLAYASGRTANLDFDLVSYPLPGNIFIVSKNNKQGLYDAGQNKMLLQMQYDTVMYKPDSFFLGWNSAADHRLIDKNGKVYKSPPVVYQAGKINNSGTIFGIGLGVNSWFYSSYNNRGKLIDEVSQFEPWMNCVIGYKNINAPYNYYTIKYIRWNRIRSYLLDAEGKPLLTSKDNPDSIVVIKGGDLLFIGKYPRSMSDDEMLDYTGIFNAADNKVIVKTDDSTGIVANRSICYVKRGDKNYYYDQHGVAIAITENVSVAQKQTGPGGYYRYNKVAYQTGLQYNEIHAFETYTNLKDRSTNRSAKAGTTEGLPFVAEGKAYLSGPQGSYVVPGNRQDYVFEDFAALKTYPEASENARFYLGRVAGKWGVYEIIPLYRNGEKEYPNVIQKVKVIAEPEYEEITVCRMTGNILFCLKNNERKVWIDSTGKVLAGGKNFDFVSSSALPNGRRLAFALDDENAGQTLHSTPYITKVMMIDPAGNILREMPFQVKQKVTPGEVFIVDDDHIITGNTVYDLATGKKTVLNRNASDSKWAVTQVNGRAVAIMFFWQTNTKPSLFTKGGTSYPTETFHIKTGKKIGENRSGHVPFFDDAIKIQDAVIMENGELYD